MSCFKVNNLFVESSMWHLHASGGKMTREDQGRACAVRKSLHAKRGWWTGF
ncbi:hypothetical protein Scep_022005 [Stephania cephalantha]|uniref:Uncharacterized protein n=1 Tax=Stephania cephalantha TaxID=152367 RepID=A0AAP0F5K5_9MAGN